MLRKGCGKRTISIHWMSTHLWMSHCAVVGPSHHATSFHLLFAVKYYLGQPKLNSLLLYFFHSVMVLHWRRAPVVVVQGEVAACDPSCNSPRWGSPSTASGPGSPLWPTVYGPGCGSPWLWWSCNGIGCGSPQWGSPVTTAPPTVADVNIYPIEPKGFSQWLLNTVPCTEQHLTAKTSIQLMLTNLFFPGFLWSG